MVRLAGTAARRVGWARSAVIRRPALDEHSVRCNALRLLHPTKLTVPCASPIAPDKTYGAMRFVYWIKELVGLESQCLHQLAPLFDFFFDDHVELVARVADWFGALILQHVAQIRSLQCAHRLAM